MWAHRSAETCHKLYGPLTEGSEQFAPCAYDPAENRCRMDTSNICIEDRV
jgi:hypothetical protein